MTSTKLSSTLARVGTLSAALLAPAIAFAQQAAPAAAPAAAAAAPAITMDKGDNTWMMVSTVLVLLMTIPEIGRASCRDRVL